MKIDEAVIDHNVDLLIGDACIWDIIGDKQEYKDASLGYIEGIHDLATKLKEALKV